MKPIEITEQPIYIYISEIFNKLKEKINIEPTLKPELDRTIINKPITKFEKKDQMLLRKNINTQQLKNRDIEEKEEPTYFVCPYCFHIFSIITYHAYNGVNHSFKLKDTTNSIICENCQKDLLGGHYANNNTEIILNDIYDSSDQYCVKFLRNEPEGKSIIGIVLNNDDRYRSINISPLILIYYYFIDHSIYNFLNDCDNSVFCMVNALNCHFENPETKTCVFCLEQKNINENNNTYCCHADHCPFMICNLCHTKIEHLIFKLKPKEYQNFLNYFICDICKIFYCPFHISNCIGAFLDINNKCSNAYCTSCMVSEYLNKENGFIQCAGEHSYYDDFNKGLVDISHCNALYCPSCELKYTLDISGEIKCIASHLLKISGDFCHFQDIVYLLFILRYIIAGPYVTITNESHVIHNIINLIQSVFKEKEKETKQNIGGNHMSTSQITKLLKQILISINKQN